MSRNINTTGDRQYSINLLDLFNKENICEGIKYICNNYPVDENIKTIHAGNNVPQTMRDVLESIYEINIFINKRIENAKLKKLQDYIKSYIYITIPSLNIYNIIDRMNFKTYVVYSSIGTISMSFKKVITLLYQMINNINSIPTILSLINKRHPITVSHQKCIKDEKGQCYNNSDIFTVSLDDKNTIFKSSIGDVWYECGDIKIKLNNNIHVNIPELKDIPNGDFHSHEKIISYLNIIKKY